MSSLLRLEVSFHVDETSRLRPLLEHPVRFPRRLLDWSSGEWFCSWETSRGALSTPSTPPPWSQQRRLIKAVEHPAGASMVVPLVQALVDSEELEALSSRAAVRGDPWAGRTGDGRKGRGRGVERVR